MMHVIKTQKHAAVEILSYNSIPFCCPEKRVIEFDITKYIKIYVVHSSRVSAVENKTFMNSYCF